MRAPACPCFSRQDRRAARCWSRACLVVAGEGLIAPCAVLAPPEPANLQTWATATVIGIITWTSVTGRAPGASPPPSDRPARSAALFIDSPVAVLDGGWGGDGRRVEPRRWRGR